MNLSYSILTISLLSCVAFGRPVAAQTTRDQAEARTLFQQQNAAPASATTRAALMQQATGFFGGNAFQPGALRTYDGRYRPVPGLRFHAGLHIVEAQDSIDLEVTHLWPVGSLRGFDLGEAGGRGESAARRFRLRLVKEGSTGTRRDFVEVLTAVDAGPLLLAWLYSSGADVTSARLSLAPLLLVGPGTSGSDPLHPIELTQAAVLKLFGARAEEVRSYAKGQSLSFDQPTEVARMIDYYNRVAVVK